MDQALPRSKIPLMPRRYIGVGKTGLGTIGLTAPHLVLLRCICWIRCWYCLSFKCCFKRFTPCRQCHPTKTPIRQSVVDLIIHHHFQDPNPYPTSLQVHVPKATCFNIVWFNELVNALMMTFLFFFNHPRTFLLVMLCGQPRVKRLYSQGCVCFPLWRWTLPLCFLPTETGMILKKWMNGRGSVSFTP